MENYTAIIGEHWEEIKEFPGYFVSDLGRVLNKNKNKILTQTLSWDGYKTVGINGRPHKVHRLVAKAFIPNPDNKPIVDHINCLRTDNRVSNLCWTTPSENNSNPLSLHNYRKAHEKREIKPIDQYDLNGNFIASYDNAMEAERGSGVRNENILQCCKGIRKSMKGFLFKFKEG